MASDREWGDGEKGRRGWLCKKEGVQLSHKGLVTSLTVQFSRSMLKDRSFSLFAGSRQLAARFSKTKVPGPTCFSGSD